MINGQPNEGGGIFGGTSGKMKGDAPNIVGNYRKIAVRKPSVRLKTLADSSPAGATIVIIRSPCVWRAITKGTTELTAIW